MKTLALILLTILLVGHPDAGQRITLPEPTEEVQSSVVEASLSVDPMVNLINLEREKMGLPFLTENKLLTVSATEKACDLRDRDYWAHVHPDGPEPWEVIINAGYNYRYAGENLCNIPKSSNCMSLFMASTRGHKENILDSRYLEVGIGRCSTFVVQHFGTRN